MFGRGRKREQSGRDDELTYLRTTKHARGIGINPPPHVSALHSSHMTHMSSTLVTCGTRSIAVTRVLCMSMHTFFKGFYYSWPLHQNGHSHNPTT